MLDTELRDLLKVVEKDLTEYEDFETSRYYICHCTELGIYKSIVIDYLIDVGSDNIKDFIVIFEGSAFHYGQPSKTYNIQWYNQQKLNHIRLAIELLNKKIEANV